MATLPTSEVAAAKRHSPTLIIVGAGLAGLSAALAALDEHQSRGVGTSTSSATPPFSVHVLERSQRPGGNSIKASSGMNGAPTRFQAEGDSVQRFLADTVRSAGKRFSSAAATGEGAARERLMYVLAERSRSAVDWLVERVGVDLGAVAQLGGHSFPRTHRGAGVKPPPPGAAIVGMLLKTLGEDDRFKLTTGAEVTRLLTDDGEQGKAGGVYGFRLKTVPAEVIGVEFMTESGQTAQLYGPVIVASGGFAGDTAGLLAEYRPDLQGMPSTNDARPGSHHLLTDVGAQLIDMDSVQVHPTGFVDPLAPTQRVKFLAAELLRSVGGLLLYKGRRFVNEMGTREHVSAAIMSLPPTEQLLPKDATPPDETTTRQWNVQLVLDDTACKAAASHVGFYLFKGLLQKQKLGDLDEETRKSLREYSRVAQGQRTDPFGRTAFGHWRLAPGIEAGEEKDEEEVCIGTVTPAVHFTMGGVVFNPSAEVLATDLPVEASVSSGTSEAWIPGLWAAGEITGGLHGDNRLGGSSLLECVVFGRIAGGKAAGFALRA